jgi:hypothetical protein
MSAYKDYITLLQAEFKSLEQENAEQRIMIASLSKEIDRLRAAAGGDNGGDELKRMRGCIGFFASVIKSGEPWTATCQREYDNALGRAKE